MQGSSTCNSPYNLLTKSPDPLRTFKEAFTALARAALSAFGLWVVGRRICSGIIGLWVVVVWGQGVGFRGLLRFWDFGFRIDAVGLGGRAERSSLDLEGYQ